MPDTPNLGWTYPSVGDCDWGTVLNTLFVDADCDMFDKIIGKDLAQPTSDDDQAGVIWDQAAGDFLYVLPETRVNKTNIRYVQLVVTDFATANTTGDGKHYFDVPADLNGYNLMEVIAGVITAGTTGVETIMVHNLTQAVDMLTTGATIDSGETSSLTAATPVDIDETNDDVATGDRLRIDRDTVHTTPAQGSIVTLGFRKP